MEISPKDPQKKGITPYTLARKVNFLRGVRNSQFDPIYYNFHSYYLL